MCRYPTGELGDSPLARKKGEQAWRNVVDVFSLSTVPPTTLLATPRPDRRETHAAIQSILRPPINSAKIALTIRKVYKP
jgi:hypothetical protein